MNKTLEDMQYKTVELIKERFQQRLYLDGDFIKDMNVDGFFDRECNRIIMSFKKTILGHKIADIKHPANWKEAFKERWFPKWLINKYPVKYKEYRVKDYYPYVALPNERSIIKFEPQEPKYYE